jgi:hypothetical protein
LFEPSDDGWPENESYSPWYRHNNRLLRDTIAKFRRILSIFFGKSPCELGPIPGIGFNVKGFAKNVG